MINRYAGTFKIKPELKDEYVMAHNQIGPDLRRAMSQSGIRNHSLFLGSDGQLIIYAEAEDLRSSMTALAESEVYLRWQEQMRKFFVEVDEDSGGAKIELFPEIFHLE